MPPQPLGWPFASWLDLDELRRAENAGAVGVKPSINSREEMRGPVS